ncbi:FAD-binding oxidoreductase [Rhizohabitans arisaemae]|uniref:FAD-binding oxidoreductase n=1 Tax=Rhizohabitans arisaemae TaxID=2720610 RepID=UPI0024B102AF|nr:FAD-binding oxidoreductase [Rhizohabitans arisaemae]
MATAGIPLPRRPGPDWNALDVTLAGRLVLPKESAYADARQLFNPAYDHIRPAAVAYPGDPAQVAACVNFARRHRVPLAVRSGGHSYAGWSTGPGLVLDVSRLNRTRYDARTGRAVIGSGARLIDVYADLAAHGRSIPAGSCPTVGIGGLVLGGGLGVVCRKYGLTCDVMESVRIVTADGRVLTCSAKQNPDLFWACRGGGGGNFGVAVSFTFRTHAAGEVVVFFLRWPFASGSAVLTSWQNWAPYAPDELWSNVVLIGPDSLQVNGVYLGSQQACESLLKQLAAMVGQEPLSRRVGRHAYLDAMKLMGGCSSLSVEQCHREGSLPGRRAGGRIPRDGYAAKSHVALRPLPGPAIQALLNHVSRERGATVIIDALKGAVGRVKPGDTAFPHRGGLFTLQYISELNAKPWLRGVHAAMGPYIGPQAYVNYIDPELADWQQAYYGANYARLKRVKGAYDPGGFFKLPQGVGG